MPRPRSERRSVWPAVVLTALLLSPMLYVASIGPTGRFFPGSPEIVGQRGAWETAYAPILWATDRSNSLNIGLTRYLLFWGAWDAADRVRYRPFMKTG